MNLLNKCGPHDKKCRSSQNKPYMKLFNMDGIQKPVALSAINQFEKQNPEISVNMLYLDDERQIVPIHTSKFCNQRKHHVNLLMLSDQDKFHYTSVQSLSRLVSCQTNRVGKTHVCQYCLHPFAKEDVLNEHLSACSQHQSQQIVYPKPGQNIVKFDKYHFQFEVKVLFSIYANFETFLQKNDDDSDMHVPSDFCVVTISQFEDHDYKLHCYTGENVLDEFFTYMQREQRRIRSILSVNKPMKHLTHEEHVKHDAATVCVSCNHEFTIDRRKIRHHCHVTGKYIAPVGQVCNLQLKL